MNILKKKQIFLLLLSVVFLFTNRYEAILIPCTVIRNPSFFLSFFLDKWHTHTYICIHRLILFFFCTGVAYLYIYNSTIYIYVWIIFTFCFPFFFWIIFSKCNYVDVYRLEMLVNERRKNERWKDILLNVVC